MSRKFRPRKSYAVRGPQWQRVHALVRCAEGHDIPAPAWALFWPFRAAMARFILCVEHAKAKGLTGAPATYTSTADVDEDVRQRQVGSE